MNRVKKSHVIIKIIWQVFILFAEIGIIAGGMTWGSYYFKPFESLIDLLERFTLFYGIYQLFVFIILSNINDIKSDEYLALANTTSLAAKACEYNDENEKKAIYTMIDKQLDSITFNDCRVREKYSLLKQLIESNNQKEIEYMTIWAGHCCEGTKLQWKYSFILRLFK